ncbi:MAG: hypothetical protein DSM106950_00620 [Stigonema ocellatum SAG 48.90 = DSM 106950]|nr:hypothetical protein [Stigonema ocellatum SAG 48.90 = DSM 106950]
MGLRIIAMGFVIFLGLNAPVMSQSPLPISQSPLVADSTLGELRINRRLWNQQKISNYRYTLTNSCFCIPEFRGPVIIEVRNGITTSITSADTGQPVNSELLQKYDTIPKLFNLIQATINRGESSLSVKYNRKLGYPTQINIGNLAADAGIFTTVEDLQEID